MLTFDFLTHRRPPCSRGRVGSPNVGATIVTVTGWSFASPPMGLLSTEGSELTDGTIPTAVVLGGLNLTSCAPKRCRCFYPLQKTLPCDVGPIASQRRHRSTAFKTPDCNDIRQKLGGHRHSLGDFRFAARRHVESLDPNVTAETGIAGNGRDEVSERCNAVFHGFTPPVPEGIGSEIAKPTIPQGSYRVSRIHLEMIRQETQHAFFAVFLSHPE